MIERDIEHLERSLALVARAISYPPTPPILSHVGSRLRSGDPSARTAPAWAIAGLIVAGLVVSLSALIGAVPTARNALADVFSGINIFETDNLSSDVSTVIEGKPVSLSDAEDALGFHIPLPSYPDDLSPQAVLLQDFDVVKAAVLSFDHDATGKFIIVATNAAVGKGLGPQAQAELVKVSMETPIGCVGFGSSATKRPVAPLSANRSA